MEDRLKKFARLVDAGSFTKAAEEMHISQPALSAAIKKLERELRVPLLTRANPIRLTDAGAIAYTAAKELAVSMSTLSLKIAEQAHKRPHISLGMIDSVADAFFGYSAGFDRLEQQADVSIVVNNSRYLAEAVLRDEVDIALIAEKKNHIHESLTAAHIGTEPLLVVCHPALYERTMHAIAEGKLPQFISYDQPSTTHQLIEDEFAKYELQPQTMLSSTSPDIMLKLALTQKGVAALPYFLVKPCLANGQLEPLRIGDTYVLERHIDTIRYRGRVLPGVVFEAVDELKHTLDRLMDEAKRLR